MGTGVLEAAITDIFISYSRKDQAFSHWLVRSFEHNQREVWLDKDDILPTSQWLADIYSGIEAADNFIFIISPDSVRSQVCGWEVAHAIKHNKRLIPVLHRDINFKELERWMADPGWEGMLPEHWKTLADLNWIMFQQQVDHNQAFGVLFQAVDTDIAYVHQHSAILVDALDWDAKGRKSSDTLRGGTLKNAEHWLTQSRGKEPQSTKLQRDYIKASRVATTRRRLITLFASGFAVIALVIVGVVAYFQYQNAGTERLAKERKALETWSLDTSAKAVEAFNNDDPGLGLNLALAAVGIDDPPLATKQTLEELAYRRGTVAAFDATLGRFDPDESSIFIVQDNALVQWDLATHEEVNRFEMDASILDFDVSASGQVILALDDGSIRGLELNSGALQNYGPGRPPLEVGTSGATFVSTGEDFLPVLRDTATGAEIFRFVSDSYVSDLSYNESRSRLLVGLGDGEMYLWDTSTGKLVRTLNWYEDPSVPLNADPQDCLLNGTSIANVSLSEDGRYAVYAMSGNFPSAVWACQLNEILVWDLIDMRVIKHLIGHDLISGVESVAINPQSDTLLSGGANELFLWDIQSGKLLQQLPAFGDSLDTYIVIEDIVFSASGRYAITATDNGKVRLWDLTPGTQMSRVELGFENYTGTLIQAMALSADGNLVLAGGQSTPRADPSTRVVDLQTGERIGSFEYHGDVYDLAITPDQGFAVEYAADGLFLNEIATGATIHDFQGRAEVGYLDGWVSLRPLIALSPDGSTVFTQGCLLDVRTGDQIACYEFGQRGLYNTEGDWIISAMDTETLVIWDPATGQEIRRFDPGINLGSLFALGPNDAEILVGSESDLVLIDLDSGNVVQTFRGHTEPVYAGDISPDGKLVISGSLDSTFRVWDRDLGVELRREKQDEAVFGAIFSNDGATAVSGDHLGRIVRWRMASTLAQLVDWVQTNRYLPELSCYEKENYQIKPLCNPEDYAWLGLTANTQLSNVVIESIEPDSPAEQAGLQIGDIVRSLDGNIIESADQVYRMLAEYRPDTEIQIEVYRYLSESGEVLILPITLGRRPLN